MITKTLKIDISSYWHAGTGSGQGALLNAVVEKDALGLPYLPGRTLKGLLRDAVYRWETFGGYDDINKDSVSITEQLFGPRGEEGKSTFTGLIRVSSAKLDDTFYQVIQSIEETKQKQLIQYLYAEHFSTAIDKETGTAIDKSLRGIELIIPTTLYADIAIVDEAQHAHLATHAFTLLAQAFPLIQAVGKHKNRGLGRAHLTWEASL
jgi:CRISPR/Cas system CSM-associated protein Csm3 (group 7 of RAMP superfamily)